MRGYVKGGVVVSDPKVELPEGIEVNVEPVPTSPSEDARRTDSGDLIGSDARPARRHGGAAQPLLARSAEAMTRLFADSFYYLRRLECQ